MEIKRGISAEGERTPSTISADVTISDFNLYVLEKKMFPPMIGFQPAPSMESYASPFYHIVDAQLGLCTEVKTMHSVCIPFLFFFWEEI